MNKKVLMYRTAFLLLFFNISSLEASNYSWQTQVNQIQQEFGVQVVFDEVDFPEYWKSDRPRWNIIDKAMRGEALRRLKIDLSHYDHDFIHNNLKKIFLLSSLSFNGQNYGGTNDHVNEWLYLHFNWLGDRGQYEEAMGFHHEFSSILFKKFKHEFDEDRWRLQNPPGFKYMFEQSSSNNLVSGKTELLGNQKLYRQGFICSYGTLTLEDDINTYSQLLIAKPNLLNKRAIGHHRIRQKATLLENFLKRIGYKRIKF